MGLGDNLAFAGVGNVNKTLNKVDDALGRTVAKIDGEVSGSTIPKTSEKISDELWDTHINAVDKIAKGEIKGGHNFDSLLTDIQSKYGLSDDDVSKMLLESKEIIPPGGVHEIKYKVPMLSPGKTWNELPLSLKRDAGEELVLRRRKPLKTVFDPAVYEPDAIRAGMDDALYKGLTKINDDGLYSGVGKVIKKDGTVVEMKFEFRRNSKGNLATAYPIK